MRGIAVVALIGFSALALAQTKTVPQLGTADRIAIAACEKQKQDAQKQYAEAQQQETLVLREFETEHPGFAVNAQTFAVEVQKPSPTPGVKK